ncbi:hypothetical protein GCM10007385_28340 [Tateyamaria omphalii]|uniref:type VI secretion system contractile sheath large subunit n=1 Tax=Tateyamaria omphalii TaxID=299262 RepID=UPI001678B9E8|nr:type VI secretion system contractile sheath large subunit [Tateyamaria omphalii]GGX58098.1 hypothetical protein GCM10007385_28340 [Tateyamaria omphalii]
MPDTRRALPPAVGRADLVRAGLDLEGADRARAAWFGFDYRAQLAPKTDSVFEEMERGSRLFEGMPLDETIVGDAEDTPIVCARLTTLDDKSSSAAEPPQALVNVAWGNRPNRPPKFYPLATGKQVQHLIEDVINTVKVRGKPNIPKVVRRIATGHPLTEVPRKEAAFRSERLQIIVDRSTRLTPLFDDQSLMVSQIRTLFPQLDVMVWMLHEATGELRPVSRDCPSRPSPGLGPLLVLGDLGLLGPPGLVGWWRALAREFIFGDGKAHALLPLSDDGPDRNLIGPWQTQPWEADTIDTSDGARVDRLLALASPTIRLEPGLLRGLRRNVLPDATIADEIALWRHPALASRSAEAASLDPDARAAYTRRLVGLATHDPDAVSSALGTIRDWRHGGADEIWYEEILGLPAALRVDDRFVDPSDLEAADTFFANMHGAAAKEDLSSGQEAWLSRIGHRHKSSRDGIWQHPHAAAALLSILKNDPNFVPPVLVETQPNAADWHANVTRDQNGVFWMSSGMVTGQALGTLTMRDTGVEVVDPATEERLSFNTVPKSGEQIRLGEIEAPFVLQSGRSRMDISAMDPTAVTWADKVVVDQIGPRADLAIGDAHLRFRWVVPGHGVVGPGPSESLNRTLQRRDELVFATGFWLMERPMVLSDMRELLGSDYLERVGYLNADPDDLKSRPADRLSLIDAEAVFEAIRGIRWEARLRLPTPLEWEYACRAGSLETTTYNGTPEPEDIFDHTLSDIAWFRPSQAMQSSVERDMTEFSAPQAVMQKRPNAWGFHDMLGNVAEWCEGDTSDPDTAVVKGGSYLHQVADVRAAYAERLKITRRETWIGLRPAIGKAEIESLRMIPRPASSSKKFIQRNRPPRVQISYDSESYGNAQQVELPFVIGVMADLSGEQSEYDIPPVAERLFKEIDANSFDDFFRGIAPRASGRVSAELPQMPGELFRQSPEDLEFDLVFKSLEDFTLDRIAERTPRLRSAYWTYTTLVALNNHFQEAPDFVLAADKVLSEPKLVDQLFQVMSDYRILELEDKVPDWRLDPDGNRRELELLGDIDIPAKTKTEAIYLATLAMACTLDEPDGHFHTSATDRTGQLATKYRLLLSHTSTEILYSEPVQKLESVWRGLHYLVNNTETDQTLKIRVMDISKDELSQTAKRYAGRDFEKSYLFKRIYEEEYGFFGGEPFGVLVGDFEFDHQSADVATLGFVAKIAETALAPFIAAASPTLLEIEDWPDLQRKLDLDFVNSQENYAAWNGLRDSEAAGFIALAVPRILARAQHGIDRPPSEFALEELTMHEQRPLPWMSAAYGMVTNVARSFKEHGWTTRIRGVQSGGQVSGLTTAAASGVVGNTELIGPVSVGITDRQEAALTRLGLLPLVHRINTDTATFIGAQTLRRPPQLIDPEQSAAANMQTRLPYVFPALRFAQYLKVIARDKMGSFMDRKDMQDHLQTWIDQYVDRNPTTSSEVQKALHPLARAEVQVDQAHGSPGVYEAKLLLTPSYQAEGVGTSLRLVTKLPGSTSS